MKKPFSADAAACAAAGAFIIIAVLCAIFAGRGASVSVTRAAEPAEITAGSDSGERDELLPGETLDLNTADEAELRLLPRIGEVLSARIVEYRRENGPFTDTAEIMNVSGIGPHVYEDIRHMLTIGGNE